MKLSLLKNLMIPSLVIGASLFASCDEDAGIQINIPQTQEVIYEIPPITNTSLSQTDTIESQLDSLLTANNATKDDIDQITLTNLSLAFTDANGVVNTNQTFNNIKSVNLSIAEINGSFSAIQSIDSAQMSAFNNVNPLVFPALTVYPNLLPYITQNSFRVQLNGSLFAPTTQTYFIKSTMTFQISVTL